MKFDKFTLKAQEALATAQQIAMAKSHTVMSPLHLLSAVCSEDTGIAIEILKKIGANISRIKEMTEGEHLLICCKKFDKACDGRHINIQIKKIPSMLMGRCEFGKEDYSLNIVNLTDAENTPEFVPEGPGEELKKKSPLRKHGNKNPRQRRLF